MMVDTLLCYIYSPTLSEALPTNIIWAHCVLLFLYQTLDAVDGKQARALSLDATRRLTCDCAVARLLRWPTSHTSRLA